MKRALSMVFVLMMFLVLQPFTASAAPSGTELRGNETHLTTTYYLSGDTTLAETPTGTPVKTDEGGATIDLNGHTLTISGSLTIVTGDLTIIDSTATQNTSGTGKVVGGTINYDSGGPNSTLHANGGTIESAVSVGVISVDDGYYGSTFPKDINSHMSIEGGNFTGTITNEDTISGGTFTGEVTNKGAISGGTFNGTVKNGYETPGHTNESSTGYRVWTGQISDGKFYGKVENSSFLTPGRINTISGGWFYRFEPTGNVEYQVLGTHYTTPAYKITYQSKNGTFLGMNVLPTSEDSSGVTPNYNYMPEGKTTSTFDGWYTDADCTHKAAAGMTITADTTLYGKAIDPEKSAEIEEPWDNPFKDVKPEDWFYESVKFVHKRGWMNGKTADTFAPYDTFTRAEVSAVLYNRAENPAVNTNRVLYADVPTDAWYTKAVYWMTDEGNATGSNGYFYPNKPVTREQFATMLYNAVGKPETNGTLFQFLDAGEASDWAVTPLCWAAEQGIMIGNGDGTLTPGAYCTRAEAAAILRNFGRAVLNP